MAAPKCSDEEFIALWQSSATASAMAATLGITERKIFERRRSIERRHQIELTSNVVRANRAIVSTPHPHRVPLSVPNGIVIVAGDAHYWPGKPSLMHRALVLFIKELKPKAVIMNGDVTDLASISRWPVVNWEKQPTVQEEIEVCQDRLHEIATAAGKARKLWPLGNHDARYSVFLAQHAQEFAKVHGLHLKDHFPLWEPCWSTLINDNTIVKHSYKGGIHAAHNNAVQGGIHMITNHLHSAKVTPWTDYTGTRYGVDTGCIADTHAPAFLYMQDNPRNWREAFAVLTYKNGELLYPELVLKWDDERVQFRGEIVRP